MCFKFCAISKLTHKKLSLSESCFPPHPARDEINDRSLTSPVTRQKVTFHSKKVKLNLDLLDCIFYYNF